MFDFIDANVRKVKPLEFLVNLFYQFLTEKEAYASCPPPGYSICSSEWVGIGCGVSFCDEQCRLSQYTFLRHYYGPAGNCQSSWCQVCAPKPSNEYCNPC